MKLRAYQSRAAKAIAEACRPGHRVLFTMPTASGKTVVAAHNITRWVRAGARVLFLAQAREIIEQTVHTLENYGVPPDLISVIMQRHPRESLDLPIQVASVHTLRRRRHLPDADIVVIDEAHHACAMSYRALVRQYANAVILGLTATPFTMNGGGLSEDFDELLIGAKPSELTAKGYLSKARIWSQPKDKREALTKAMKKVRSRGGDYELNALGRTVSKPRLIGDIVEHWQRLGQDRPTVAYAVNISHARRILRAFLRAGIPAELVTADTPEEEREAMLARLQHRETKVIINCMILTEGWDCPIAKCIVLARPTKSLRLYLQMLGRGLRPGLDLIVLDHAGVAHRFGFPNLDREMTLESGNGGGGEAPCKVCPECEALVLAGAGECPECGHAFAAHRGLSVAIGDLCEVDPSDFAKEANRVRRLAAQLGFNERQATQITEMRKHALGR